MRLVLAVSVHTTFPAVDSFISAIKLKGVQTKMMR